jgi:uncharacterized protein DUF3108
MADYQAVSMSSLLSAKVHAARCAVVLAAAGLMLAACSSATSSAPGGSGGSAPMTSPGGNGGGGGNSNGSGASTLFPYAVGDTWVYNVSLGTSGHGTATNKIVAVTPVSDGNKVTMTVTDKIPGLPTPTTNLVYVFHPDGSITVPYAQTANGQVTIKSGSIVWPSQAVLDSGQPHKSTLVVQLTIAGHTLTVKAHVTVQGGGTQSVTVPAGTYRATVVNETISEKIAGIAVTTVVKTFLAPGVGPVKSQVLASSSGISRIAAADVLKSFTKG